MRPQSNVTVMAKADAQSDPLIDGPYEDDEPDIPKCLHCGKVRDVDCDCSPFADEAFDDDDEDDYDEDALEQCPRCCKLAPLTATSADGTAICVRCVETEVAAQQDS